MADDLSNRNYFKAGWDFRDGQGRALRHHSLQARAIRVVEFGYSTVGC
jgi:hypothetical protein